ncbi:cysteine peptidase family C39 domain-containing protein [Mucilaginibacter sp.]|jgi:ABC-type bacteriocin/lantibiotic exporter with double-glycine peptidase domain|uniref:cysteine peptidase family C39 domain-containing protein n=1 Tax=Mucilaginibacter sp. TaxID=1882438 RepID=UPI003568D10E
MKNIGFYQSCYVRQSNENNCGLACMAMIFRFTGEYEVSHELVKLMDTNFSELSLLELKTLMERYNRKSRCVRIEAANFRCITSPVILHTVNPYGAFHFVTLFVAKKLNGQYFYVIGDPGTDIKIIDESHLLSICVSRSALYIVDIDQRHQKGDFFLWRKAFNWNLIPKPLWFFIPLIHLLSFIMGISLSALLQQLLTGKETIRQLGFRIAILTLLAISIVCKGILNHIKQQLLIRVNKIINLQLINKFASLPVHHSNISRPVDKSIQKHLIIISKYQLSINGVFSIALSEGLLLVTLLGCLLYLDLLAASVTLFFSAFALCVAIKRLPDDLLFAKYLSDLHAESEQVLMNSNAFPKRGAPHDSHRFDTFYERYINEAAANARQLSRTMFNNEVLGGINIIVLIALGFFTGDHSAPFIVGLTILGYLVLIILQRIITSLPVIFDGAQAAHSLQQL